MNLDEHRIAPRKQWAYALQHVAKEKRGVRCVCATCGHEKEVCMYLRNNLRGQNDSAADKAFALYSANPYVTPDIPYGPWNLSGMTPERRARRNP